VHRRPRLTGLAPGTLALTLLAACASTVDVEAAPSATDPLCAEVMVAVRSDGFARLGDRERRPTSSQSTAAWGDPAVVLRCGVEPLGPTTDACVGVDGVDWVLREVDGRPTYTTYGRVPAVEVVLPDADSAGADVVLGGLGPLVADLPQDRECL
jgi:hypothetical protein